MKKSISLYLLSATLLCAGESDFTNFIEEIHIDSDGVPTYYYLNDLESAGTTTSLAGVAGTALFRLYTIKNSDSTEYFLNEASTDSFVPEAEITFIVDDPYVYSDGSRKTRADIGYDVEIEISGIIVGSVGSGITEQTNVVYTYEAYQYSEDTLNVSGNALIEASYEYSNNGTQEFNNVKADTSITRSHGGEDVHTTYAATSPFDTQLDAKKIRVFPTSDGSFGSDGFDNTVKVEPNAIAACPLINISVENIYPGSEFYLRFYSGSYSNTPQNSTKIEGSGLSVANDDTPYSNEEYPQQDVDDQFLNDGVFTLELVEETPFNESIIVHDYKTFTLERMVINANIVGSE
ncbi:MAG: hypothetical protein ACSHXL_03545 [Bacteroidota bacterium]